MHFRRLPLHSLYNILHGASKSTAFSSSFTTFFAVVVSLLTGFSHWIFLRSFSRVFCCYFLCFSSLNWTANIHFCFRLFHHTAHQHISTHAFDYLSIPSLFFLYFRVFGERARMHRLIYELKGQI